MNPDRAALRAQAQVMLRRQQQALQNIHDELASSQNKLREMSRLRDDLLARLFPPMRADRNSDEILEQLEMHLGEAKVLKQAMIEQDREIRALEAEILTDDIAARLTQGRDNLLNLRHKLLIASSNVKKMRNIITPVRILPPEVLGYIFSYADESRLSPDDHKPDILSISQSCTSWRSVAINTPSLWSDISVTIEGGIKRPGWLSLIEMWLERSRTYPLKFNIRENARLDVIPTSDSDFFRILDLYLPHIQRWRSVSLINPHFSSPGWFWFNKLPVEISCPLLESLSLKCDILENSDILQIKTLTNRAPRLRHLTWRYNGELSHPEFPWAQLTHLELVSLVVLPEVLNILSSGTNLVSADFTLQAHSSMVEGRTLPHIVHQNLKFLTLGISGDLVVLLDFLTLPKLTVLTVDILSPMVIMVTLGGSNAVWKHDHFLAFLRRSQCNLRLISFVDVRLEPGELLDLLRHLSPSLVDLTVENVKWTCVTDQVLKALTYTPHPTLSSTDATNGESTTQGVAVDELSTLCPHLECLRLGGCIESTDGVLADMVQSRLYLPKETTGLATLNTAQFSVHPDRVQPQDFERLVAMRRDTGRDVGYAPLEPDELREMMHPS